MSEKLYANSRKYWKERGDKWVNEIWDGFESPHRKQLLEILKKLEFDSILEVGCGSAPNLRLIAKEFPKVKIAGLDLNKNAIDFAKRNLKGEFIVGDYLNIPFKDFDIVLTDGVLLYASSNEIKWVKSELLRVAKKYIIMVEFHSDKFDEFGEMYLEHWTRDYKKLFQGAELHKILGEDSEKWQEVGYIIVVKLMEKIEIKDIGYLKYNICEGDDGMPTFVELLQIWVEPTAREKGYGSQLLEKLGEITKKKNIGSIFVKVTEGNKDFQKFLSRNKYSKHPNKILWWIRPGDLLNLPSYERT